MGTHVYRFINAESSGSTTSVEATVITFNATSSWTGPSGGHYTQLILESTHGKGTDPVSHIYETIAGVDTLVHPDQLDVNISGDITITVTDNARFEGKIVILGVE